jgi:hypothetical protein
MKLKPGPLVWVASVCIVIFIGAGTTPVSSAPTALSGPLDCGSPWNDLGKQYYPCAGSHVGAIVVMSFAAAVGITCLALFAMIVLPDALRPDVPSGGQTRLPPSPGPQQPVKPSAGPQRIQAPAGWYIDPKDSTLLRWWTGEKFSDAAKPRDD